ncbi:MAG: MarC family protein [Deltaproteobacteria bacterium]|nr:MarC family protein [Deltaproteobacteria bacterium]
MEQRLQTFITLFIVIDPIGIATLFMALVHAGSKDFQKKMALRGTITASAILFIFFFMGDRLLKLLGIGIPAFRIAGGTLLFLIAIDMVFARQSGIRSTTAKEQEEAIHKNDISVFPLAFPLIAGPGALTTVLLMAAAAGPVENTAAMVLIIAFVLALTLLSLLFAAKISHLLGETGANMISRLLGLILSALAIQYIIDGIKAAFFL